MGRKQRKQFGVYSWCGPTPIYCRFSFLDGFKHGVSIGRYLAGVETTEICRIHAVKSAGASVTGVYRGRMYYLLVGRVS